MTSILKSILIVLFLSSCGTQDYSYRERISPLAAEGPSEEMTVEGWREAALRTINDDPEVLRGEMEDLEMGLAAVVPYSPSCPPEFVCLKNPYMGAVQFGKMAALYPEFFQLSGEAQQQTLTIAGISRLLVQSEIVELESTQRLHFCGGELMVFASEMVGGGIIDGSAGHCEEVKVGSSGSDIRIFAGHVEGVQILSNGKDGADGLDGVVNWPLVAQDGNPQAVQIASETKYADLDICADLWSCRETYEKKIKGRDEKEKAAARLEWMEDHYKKLEAYGLKRALIEEHLVKAERANTRAWAPQLTNCWVRSKEGFGRETGRIESVKVTVGGVEGLNGRDAKHKSQGTRGIDGGDSGRIEIVSMSAKIPRPRALAGKGGKAGKSFVQRPGRGVESRDSSFEWKGRFYGWFECLYQTGKTKRENGKIVPIVDAYYKVPLDIELKETLSLSKIGGSLRIADLRSLSKFKGYGALRGVEGKALSVEQPGDGKEGEEYKPNVVATESREFLERKRSEFCSTCELPMIMVELTDL